MSQKEVNALKRALDREKASRKAAEEILEAKSAQLYEVNQELEASHKELARLYSKTNSQLQGVFENIVDAYVIIDLWGNVLKMNEAAIELLGFNYKDDDINLMSLVVAEDLPRITPYFRELLVKGAITDFKITINTKKNQKKFVHVNASTIYEDGIAVAAQGIVRDITLENKYQQALVAEKQKYGSIIANMNLGLVEVNNNDEILMVNQRFQEMSEYDEEELIGKDVGIVFRAEENNAIIKKENEKRQNGELSSYELKVKSKTGEIKYWLISGAPNYDLQGNIVGSIGIHLDITELKNLELQKEKLLQKLEKSNEELNEYAHVVSHDLKSPLRSIDALVSWLKEDNKDKLDEVSLQNIGLIETTLEKMEQLISDILDYSSASSSNQELVQVDTQALVDDLLQTMYVPKNIEVITHNALPTVKGDKTKLQQVFLNLISNAVKFNDKEKGLIEINVEDEDRYYKFSIKDNGIGIEPKFHEKIFKIFHSLNKRKDSTGIGLSLVKKIVNMHNGKIWLDSTPGETTTFYFTLKK
ncbi:PAS domain S-box protein [Winogradskyella sp.]|jgi:PAS domain S-box-containing protein|uniref:sensor histidine kinase n=1 Tax=Winogradskyella sp. TaxID=1883156 RepID=UPI0025F8DCD3|nr:PAS domain-containing sensor histidine kinase [Winogradskyella sp.]MCT4630368.1 PAS domain S-box protein [Winogradskyella sp.]